MKFGKVIGQVIATRKEGKTEGLRMLVCELLKEDMKPSGRTETYFDTVNARTDDIVLLCTSSSARTTTATKGTCCDAAIVGIVDSVSSDHKATYRKGQ